MQPASSAAGSADSGISFAAHLGEVPYAGQEPAAEATACAASSGTVTSHGLMIEARWVNFYDVTCGLPALAQWLSDQGCRQLKYDLHGPGWMSGLGDLADEED